MMKFSEFKTMYLAMMREIKIDIDIPITDTELIKLYIAVKVNAKWLHEETKKSRI